MIPLMCYTAGLKRFYDGNEDKLGIDQASDYKEKGNMNFFLHGHFSQVVWRSSTEFGCGHASKPNQECTIQVCRYSEPGNCDLYCANGECDNRNIPSERWERAVFANEKNNHCTIPQKWWNENKV
mmetsp:Transcript_46992/g.69597  ORF Transcript_46992/g.69597 Transcript_46992/m.69597 type:complete len:125 (+) Transcript_46992:741-1115(+)